MVISLVPTPITSHVMGLGYVEVKVDEVGEGGMAGIASYSRVLVPDGIRK